MPNQFPDFFTVTEDHIKLARNMYVQWDEGAYEGAPAIGQKRPYGNSDVIGDLIEILGIEVPDAEEFDYPEDVVERVLGIHREMEHVLQIFLCTGQMKAGRYMLKEKYNVRSWTLIE